MWRQMKIRCHENAFWLGPISGAKHPHCHSLPSRAGGENMKNKSEKTFRSRHRQFNRWMKKETERAKKKKRQRKSLTTSYLQANAQPVTGNYTPPLFFFLHPSFYCWAWHCMPQNITPLASLGQPSWPLPLPACSPARGRVGKALMLHRHCSAKARTVVLSALF